MSSERSTKVQSLPLLNAGLNVGQLEKLEMEREAAKHGLGVITAAIFLAGEMAGSGVLALPFAMVGTGKTLKSFRMTFFSFPLFVKLFSLVFQFSLFSGWAGVTLILLFTLNAAFSGTRLGLCWVILEERYAEFRKEIRDPYPSIGEKAVGKWGR